MKRNQGSWYGPASPALEQALRALETRFVGRVRQRSIAQQDPLHFEPCIELRHTTLGFHHMYTRESDGYTRSWLESEVYVDERAKRHPIDLCHLAIAQFHDWLRTGEAPARTAFLASAEELLAGGHQIERAQRRCFEVLHYDQVEGYQTHEKPWRNAMAQGWAASLFCRAYQLTGDERFADAARASTGPFFVPVQEGGVLSELQHGAPWYEKYAFRGQVRHVLNGFLSSLLGLADLARALDDAAAKERFERGIEALLDERTLRAFDIGYATLYDLGAGRRTTPAGVFYTWVHARQLAGLARLTNEQRLWSTAERWRDYLRKKRYRVRSSTDCMLFRVQRLPTYIERALSS